MTTSDLHYQDDWAAGWQMHRYGDTLAHTEITERRNTQVYSTTGRPERVTTGMVDGWRARDAAVTITAWKTK